MLRIKLLGAAFLLLAGWEAGRGWLRRKRAAIAALEEMASDLISVQSLIVLERRPIAEILNRLCEGSAEKTRLYQSISRRLQAGESTSLRGIFAQEAAAAERALHLKKQELAGFVFGADAIEQSDPERCRSQLECAAEMLRRAAAERREEFTRRAAMIRGVFLLGAAAICLLLL